MIQRQLKLRLTKKQERICEDWLWQLTGVFNFAIRKIEQDSKGGIYYSKFDFANLLADHSRKIGMPSHTMQAMMVQAYSSWERCFKKISKKPRLKGNGNKLASIPFPDAIKPPKGNKVRIPCLGLVRHHKQSLPDGKIKNGRIIKRASGWYLALAIDAQPNISNNFKPTDNGQIGIDPGFRDLLALSDGTKIKSPLELNNSANRLAQAQRGNDKKLVARLHERISNQKKDRNHKLSRQLVETYQLIVFSKDNISAIKKRFGKSVANANHYQLRQMLASKSNSCGRTYIEVGSKNSTKTCSTCGALSGPTGLAGLSVREWVCTDCGSSHDRDINSAIVTLNSGVGTTLERRA